MAKRRAQVGSAGQLKTRLTVPYQILPLKAKSRNHLSVVAIDVVDELQFTFIVHVSGEIGDMNRDFFLQINALLALADQAAYMLARHWAGGSSGKVMATAFGAVAAWTNIVGLPWAYAA